MDDGYTKADSTNLPKINSWMVAKFFALNSEFCSAELKNLKKIISASESYGDDAIGYVQLKRDQNICIVKCTVNPDHSVRSKPYIATILVDENAEVVIDVQCKDCLASEGVCKHGIALMMWLHRRSEEPSYTSVECYWKQSNLTKIGSSFKILPVKKMTKHKPSELIPDYGLVNEFIMQCKKRKITTCQFIKYETDFEDCNTMMSLYRLMFKYTDANCDSFLLKISEVFNHTVVENIEQLTQDQHNSELWNELTYGRITDSKCYKVCYSDTDDGITIVLDKKLSHSPGITKVKKLEDKVKSTIEKNLGIKIKKCGLYISDSYPMIAASPKGIFDNITFEIKYLTHEKTMEKYISKDGQITKRYLAQVQIQMYCTGAEKSYFCVVSNNFDNNDQILLMTIDYNQQYVESLLQKVVSFWKNNIFPILYKSVTI